MFDYLSSKVVWIIAALVMTASIFGAFMWQRNSMEEVELGERAEGVVDIVDEICNTDAELISKISFNKSSPATFYLQPTINDKGYKLNFTPNGVFLVQDEKRIWNQFVENIHIYDPFCLHYETSSSILNKIDLDTHYLELNSGEDFIIESKEFNRVHHVFIYKETDEKIRNRTLEIKGSFTNAFDWTPEKPENKRNITLPDNTVFKNDYFYIENETKVPGNIKNVNLWKPISNSTTWDELERKVSKNVVIRINKDENITAETRVMDIEDTAAVLCYLYKPTIQPVDH